METAFTPSASLGGGAAILGPASFGIGRGIAGFCPGGALPALGTGAPALSLFLAALIGLLIARALQARAPARKPA